MSSSSRLLAQPTLGEPRPLGAPPPAADPFVEALVADASEAAYQRGRAEGELEARAALEAASGRIQAAFAAVREQIAALQAARAEADLALAEAIATAVAGAEPHDGGRALLDRLRDALAALDDAPLVVRVHPGDADLLAGALDREGEVEVRADGSLRPGEALVEGCYATADLTRDAAWEAVRAVLAGAGEVQP